MAKDERSTADKGKGKVEDRKELSGGKKENTKLINGKKDGHAEEEELSEEDQQLKGELEMLVERLHEPKTSLYKPALDAIKTSIKTSTSSMTAVPKPLKFLRPHYDELVALFEMWEASPEKDSLADMLSLLGMTYGDEEKLETLKYRLLSRTEEDLGSWGHEYIRHLALEIGQEYQNRVAEDKDVKDLTDLSLSLVPYFLKHNAEADAVDLLSELEMIEEITKFVDENTYPRVCLYMVGMVNLLTYPDNHQFLKTAHDIYLHFNQLAQAMIIAIRLNDISLIQSDLNATKDKSLRRQLAFLIARQNIWLTPSEDEEDENLANCLNNTELHNHFKDLGKQLNVLDPKMPEDIYKTYLESGRGTGLTNVDSARHNLASAFVNAFINAAFCNDKMMLVDPDKQPWIWKTKDDGMLSTTASLGMLTLWDVENHLDLVYSYMESDEVQIKAGALLGVGILNSGVRSESDPALALLGNEETVYSDNVKIRVCSIMGLGLAYAGSCREELLELLLPIIEDTSIDMQVSAIAALALGMIFVGSSNHQVSESIATTLLDEERQRQMKDKWTRFMALGLALLYLGRQEEVDVVLDILKAIDAPMAKPAAVLASVCAWAGTGAVLKIQELLHICTEPLEDKEETKGDELIQSYAVLGLSLIAMGEDIGSDMILRQFGHLMHYGQSNIRKAVPLAMGLISPSNPQMKVYDTLSRYSHDNDNDVAINAIFAMGLLGAGTNNARLAQLLRQLASYYQRDPNSLFMVRIAQGLVHMGKGTLSINPFHTDRQVLSPVAAAGLLTVLTAMIDAREFILADSHYLLYYLVTAIHPRFLVTLGEDLKPLTVNVRVGQAVDIVGQAGRPKSITGWQTQSTPVLLGYGERAELEDEEYISLSSTLEGLVILRKNPDWESS